jgi:hypothetical protein
MWRWSSAGAEPAPANALRWRYPSGSAHIAGQLGAVVGRGAHEQAQPVVHLFEVWVIGASSPCSSETVTCHSCWERPRWSGVASTKGPSSLGARKKSVLLPRSKVPVASALHQVLELHLAPCDPSRNVYRKNGPLE